MTSWLHEEGTAIEIFPERDPRGKYTLLQSGDLLIHHTSTYDTYKKYVCKTEHILSGIRRRSLNPARLTLKGIIEYLYTYLYSVSNIDGRQFLSMYILSKVPNTFLEIENGIPSYYSQMLTKCI